eukprot:1149303-Pelagomonas_calceolata.AAC.6
MATSISRATSPTASCEAARLTCRLFHKQFPCSCWGQGKQKYRTFCYYEQARPNAETTISGAGKSMQPFRFIYEYSPAHSDNPQDFDIADKYLDEMSKATLFSTGVVGPCNITIREPLKKASIGGKMMENFLGKDHSFGKKLLSTLKLLQSCGRAGMEGFGGAHMQDKARTVSPCNKHELEMN